MPPATTDIHPHIVAGDIRRYPRAPLGGKLEQMRRTRRRRARSRSPATPISI
jgi:hypothetical protein